ncbi:hypothetical protein cypCar_00004598 [Cyprinus carpio]|nr:hypothetical protein cypCar_00004598 [Cyprinus carpio]
MCRPAVTNKLLVLSYREKECCVLMNLSCLLQFSVKTYIPACILSMHLCKR